LALSFTVSEIHTATYSLKLSVENCGQTATDENMAILTASALSEGNIADFLRLTV